MNAPNIQLSADGVELSLDEEKKTLSIENSKKSLSPAALEKGALLFIEGISEASMQPFQPTEGPLSNTLGLDSTFFFRPRRSFTVRLYEDTRSWNKPGPELVDVSEAKLLGKGKLTLGESRYVDSVLLNRDPFEIKEGSEKSEAWKKIFLSIGKELE